MNKIKRKSKLKVVKCENDGYKIQSEDGLLSMESYYTKKGAQKMIDGTFGSAGGIR